MTEPVLASRYLGTMAVVGMTPIELGTTPYGRRRVVGIAGGTVTGPHLNGEILASGQDSALVRSDGIFEHDVRMILRLDGDELVRVTYSGRWNVPNGELERLLRREGDLSGTPFYLRTALYFETATTGRYAWLNAIAAIGVGRPRMGTTSGIEYDIHEIG